jgi:hypothetical protein
MYHTCVTITHHPMADQAKPLRAVLPLHIHHMHSQVLTANARDNTQGSYHAVIPSIRAFTDAMLIQDDIHDSHVCDREALVPGSSRIQASPPK